MNALTGSSASASMQHPARNSSDGVMCVMLSSTAMLIFMFDFASVFSIAFFSAFSRQAMVSSNGGMISGKDSSKAFSARASACRVRAAMNAEIAEIAMIPMLIMGRAIRNAVIGFIASGV